MMYRLIASTALCLLLLFKGVYADTTAPVNTTTDILDYVFSDTQPNQKNITQAWCTNHAPTAMVTSEQQLQSKASGLNGVSITYNSVFTSQMNGIYFKTISGTLSGVDVNNNTWSTDLHIYETYLTPTSPIYGVWSTDYCKGRFVATPSATSTTTSSTT